MLRTFTNLPLASILYYNMKIEKAQAKPPGDLPEGGNVCYTFAVYKEVKVKRCQRRTREDKNMMIETNSAQETFALGKKLGELAQPGQIYTLVGDLGVGKTVFTQGLADGLGITEPISSPTFTIIQEYEEGRLPFYHFDVYRIGDIEEMEEIGYDDYFFGQGVCMIEWANLIEELLPENIIQVVIEKDLDKGFDYRRITITGLEGMEEK